MSAYEEQFDTFSVTLEKELETCNLVVYNDDVNTFDWVIETLVYVCDHTFEQASQCAIFIHTKGKYAVKEGSFTDLKPLKDIIVDRGIQAAID